MKTSTSKSDEMYNTNEKYISLNIKTPSIPWCPGTIVAGKKSFGSVVVCGLATPRHPPTGLGQTMNEQQHAPR